MNARNLRMLAAIATLVGTQPAAAADEAAPAVQPMSKGIELYCQRDQAAGQWRFACLPGTNRLKSAEEVREALDITGIDALKKTIAGFPKGTRIFLQANDWPGKPEGVTADEPDRDTLRDLVAFCAEREIRIGGGAKLFAEPNLVAEVLAASETRRELDLSESPLNGEGLKLVADKFPNLETLRLHLCELGGSDLSALGRLKSLKQLDLGENYATGGQDFGFLASLDQLESLDLSYCQKLTDEALAAVGKCGSLRTLKLGNCKLLTDKGVAGLAGLQQLEHLALDHCPALTDESLATIGGLPKLRSLDFRWSKGMTDARVMELAKAKWSACELVLPSGKITQAR